jgi:hypothetical protein
VDWQIFNWKLFLLVNTDSSVSLDNIPNTHQILSLKLFDVLIQLILLQKT